MIEFNNLKNSYISAIQWGMLAKESSYSLKQGNETGVRNTKRTVVQRDRKEL